MACEGTTVAGCLCWVTMAGETLTNKKQNDTNSIELPICIVVIVFN